MQGAAVRIGIVILFAWILSVSTPMPVWGLEEGEITGQIERTNDNFPRDYGSLDYKGEKKWAKWGKDLKALGWIVVQGDSGELKDYLLLVVDTRTKITKGGGPGQFADLKPGVRVQA